MNCRHKKSNSLCHFRAELCVFRSCRRLRNSKINKIATSIDKERKTIRSNKTGNLKQQHIKQRNTTLLQVNFINIVIQRGGECTL